MKVTIVAGARPNFMKIAPIIKQFDAAKKQGSNISYRLVHTGQHYDKKMSADFFDELQIPYPDVNLECGGGTQAEQTASIMVRFEKELGANKPDVVIVVGDVTSTMACTITAKKLCVDVAHVEGGIRSGDMTMPEEINRIVTDSICDHFFTTSECANELLKRTGVDAQRIHFVGNTMIDSLYNNIERLVAPAVWNEQKLSAKNYFLVTLHRPSNVDEPQQLASLIEAILNSTGNLPVIFPVHPRTMKNLTKVDVAAGRLICTEPMSYLQFIYLVKHAKAVITDSGGITEEATVLDVPCMTLRNSTERPETVTMGSNELVGTDADKLKPYLKKVMSNNWKSGTVPPLWDGRTSERIVAKLLTIYN